MLNTSLAPPSQEVERREKMEVSEEWMCVARLSLSHGGGGGDVGEWGEGGREGAGSSVGGNLSCE